MDSLDVLREAICTIPVPSAPPRLSMDGAAIGLGFLDAALRLNHVRRLTDRLTIVKHRIAHRRTEVDISINMLTDTQLQASRTFQNLTSHSSDASADLNVEAPVWVPVARLSRTNVGPLEVHDSAGRRLPRLTQYEVSRLIASGLYRLLRGILVSHPDSRDAESDLGKLLFQRHEPRWIIQSAILTILTDGSRPLAHVDTEKLQDRIAIAEADPSRKMALDVFSTYNLLLSDYIQLFDVAVKDHIVVVALDSRFNEHLLTYESPLYVKERDSWAAQIFRLIRASRQGYYVRYHTDIPTTLRSYHLVGEAAEGIDISRIFLTTNAYEAEVNRMVDDLEAVAAKIEERGVAEHRAERQVLELETEVLLRQLSELLRRRRWEANNAGVRAPQECVSLCNELVGMATEHEIRFRRDVDDLQPLIVNPRVSASKLRGAASEISKYELRTDLVLEAQPTSSMAHVYWRRPAPSHTVRGRTDIRARMLLQNTAESSTRMVVIYALIVAGIAYMLACLISRSPWPYSPASDKRYAEINNVEAITAILLLVPGFWYTRLSLPERHSVAGHLRAVPRLVAYLCIASMVTLAAAVAAGAPTWLTRAAFLIGAGAPLASTFLLVRIGSQQTGLAKTLARLNAPLWATYEDARTVHSLSPDVSFSSSRPDPETRQKVWWAWWRRDREPVTE